MKVSRHHEMETFADREIVFREGEQTRDMYVIHEGRVEILKHAGGHEVQLAVLERGSFFGEMSMLEGLPRSATARALGLSTPRSRRGHARRTPTPSPHARPRPRCPVPSAHVRSRTRSSRCGSPDRR